LGGLLEVVRRRSKAIKRMIAFCHRNFFRTPAIPDWYTVFEEKIDGHLVHGRFNNFEKDSNVLGNVCVGGVGM